MSNGTETGASAGSVFPGCVVQHAARDWLERWPKIQSIVDTFFTKVLRQEIVTPLDLAKHTTKIMQTILSHCQAETAADMVQSIRAIGTALINAQPLEFSIGHIIRRVLCIIREEAARVLSDSDAPTHSANQKRCTNEELKRVQFDVIQQAVLGLLYELVSELDVLAVSIAAQAKQHIHANEIILTSGDSDSVLAFLAGAATADEEETTGANSRESEGRPIEVFVAEAAPTLSGHAFAKKLAASSDNITATVIKDEDVFAIMARVNKVVIGTHAVMADGGLIAPAGTHALTIAAQYYRVPVVVVTGTHKLCPHYPHHQDSFNKLRSPASIAPFASEVFPEKIEVVAPMYDYVAPACVSLFVTNSNALQPTHVYRLVADSFALEDYDLENSVQ